MAPLKDSHELIIFGGQERMPVVEVNRYRLEQFHSAIRIDPIKGHIVCDYKLPKKHLSVKFNTN